MNEMASELPRVAYFQTSFALANMIWNHSQPELKDEAHFPWGRALLHGMPFLSYSYKMAIHWPSEYGLFPDSPIGGPAQRLTINSPVASSCE